MISIISMISMTLFFIYPIGAKAEFSYIVPDFKGKTMYMTCRVTDADNLNTTIQFVRNSDQATVCSCEQRGDLCSCDTTGYRDYMCTCADGTNRVKSRYKDYTITKHNTNNQDTGVWLCGSEAIGWSTPGVAVIGKY